MQIIINNIKINFEVYGSGKPIVYLHGWGSELSNWYPLIDYAPQDYQHFLLDLPGFGNSETPKESWGIDEYVDFLSKFMQELEIKDSALVGHSFGGKIAVKFASRTKNVSKLILISTSGVDKKNFITKVKISLAKFAKLFFSKNVAENIKNKIGSTDYKQAGQKRKILNKVTNQLITQDLQDIPVPTLIIWGDQDNILDISQAKIFESLITNAYLRVVWETDHFPQIRNPKLTASYISEFLNE